MLGNNQDKLQKITYRAKQTNSCLSSVGFHGADTVPLAFHPCSENIPFSSPMFILNPRMINDDNILLLEKILPHPQGVVSLHGLQLHVPKTGNI